MKKLILGILLSILTAPAFAWCNVNLNFIPEFCSWCNIQNCCKPCGIWCHSIDIGYGRSQDPNHSRYSNYGGLLTADLLPIYRNYYTFWTINVGIGRWKTTTPINKNLTTAAVSLALRYYPWHSFYYSPYLLGSFGPAYFSDLDFGLNSQAYHYGFQTNLGLGTEIRCFDINFRLTHYSNAGIKTPNDGFNILYLLSIGYLF